MKTEIRKANSSDLKQILKLFHETIISTCLNDYSPEQIKVWVASVKDEERWLDCIEQEYFIVVEIADKMLGFASLRDGNYINFLYVHKNYLRKGIAQMLFDALKEKATDKPLISDVSITALPFFKKQGFKIVRQNKNIRNGVEIINYRMEL